MSLNAIFDLVRAHKDDVEMRQAGLNLATDTHQSYSELLAFQSTVSKAKRQPKKESKKKDKEKERAVEGYRRSSRIVQHETEPPAKVARCEGPLHEEPDFNGTLIEDTGIVGDIPASCKPIIEETNSSVIKPEAPVVTPTPYPTALRLSRYHNRNALLSRLKEALTSC
jgi:hypothetical protein